MLILASQSPRRAQLLDQVGIAFEASSAGIDEAIQPGEGPADYVRRLALTKALAVHRRIEHDVVLGADTAVVIDRRILGKPSDRETAVGMLHTLSGRTHEVLTGVALVGPPDAQHYALSISRVSFRMISTDEAERYWATGEPIDKAGGYAIQGVGSAFVERIEGSYSGIMGLPIFETLDLLRRVGIHCPIEGPGGV